MTHSKINKFSLENVDRVFPNGINHFIVNHPRPLVSHFSKEAPYLFNGVVLGLCTQGEATIWINQTAYTLKKGYIYVVLPMQEFKIDQRSDNYQQRGVCFEYEFFTDFALPADFATLFNISRTPSLKVSHEVMNHLESYFAIIAKRYSYSKPTFRVQIMRGLAYSLFLEIAAQYQDKEVTGETASMTRKEKVARKFFTLLTEHYKQERSVAFYAQQLCVTRKYLSLVLKETTGYPALKWVIDFVINDVKNKLKNTDLTVLQISEEFNFPNPSFFGQFFKKYTGITPYKYKRSKQGTAPKEKKSKEQENENNLQEN
jgi:AraC-like DNA-binding protein